MIKTLPGTNINLPSAGYSVDMLLSSLFLPGGLVLSQICGLTGLPPYVLQNWVKRGFVPPPVNKKYSQSQFCRVAIINSLHDVLNMESIIKLIYYVTDYKVDGCPASLDDTALYRYFAQALLIAEKDINALDGAINTALKGFTEPYPGTRERLQAVVKAMAIFYISAQIKSSAELMVANLGLVEL